MTTHVSDELPRLLTGEASREVVLDAAAHLRTCIDCQQELVSAVVAHASLSSAQRYAPEIVAPGVHDDEQSPARPLPDLSAIFSQVREEAAEHAQRSVPKRSRRTRYLVGAAAAAVLIGGGAAVIAGTGNDNNGTPAASRTIELSAFGQGHTPAKAVLTGGDQMRIDASSLPQLPGKGYEVWLTDEQRTNMKPIGWIGRDGTATIMVPPNLMRTYTDIEVSVQDVHAQTYSYSNVSVLRGSYR
jgi:Anti-sigma-K factor rskA